MKKNGSLARSDSFGHFKEILLKMKLTVLLFLIGFVHVFAAKTYAQTTKLKMELRDVSIVEVLKAIENQSEFYFIYNNESVNLSRKVSINAKDRSINDILDYLFKDTDISYKIVDRHIILSAIQSEQGQPAGAVKGVVTGSDGQPIPGVSVSVKGTTIGTITNSEGAYSLSNVNSNSTLVFSFVGMKTQEMKVGGLSKINVKLVEETVSIDEVVAVGYGAQKKASLTAAISNMKTEQIVKIPSTNLSNVLAGRLSGTFVRSSTGTPGISSDIRIRGVASFSDSKYNVPLYVIDGVVRDKTSFDALDANEVEEITVLKDAASAAIYGSRSANGVVLVNTKKGKSGMAKVEYSSIFGTQKTGKLPEYMDMREALNLSNSVTGGMSTEEIEWALKTNPGGMNLYNAAYQDPTNQKHSVSISGGSDKVNYYIGGSYLDENGFLPNVWYKKYNLRANVSANITKDLTVGLNISNSYGTRNRFNFTYDYGSADLSNLWGKLLYWDVYTPPYIDGKPVNPGWLGNPVEMMKNGGYWRNNNQQIDALVTIEYKIPYIKGLSVKASYSRNMDNSYVKNFAKKQLLYNFKRSGTNNLMYTNEVVSTQLSGDPGTEYIGNEYTKTDAYQLNGQVNFDRHFGKHNVNATAVYEQYEYQYNFFKMYRYNFPLFPTDQFFAASKSNSDWSTDGNESQDGRLSYIGRVNYDYAGKYFFSASVRRDGSVKFAPDQRWGWFPSASAGWLISEERFYQNSNIAGLFNMMKLRASFGSTGNDGIGGWAWQDQYNIQSSSFYIGGPGTAAPRLAYGGIPNTKLTWEKSNSYDLGIDLRFLQNFTFTADFWKRKTSDILGPRILVLPSEFGGNLPAVNYGKVNTQGFELELGYNNKIGNDFNFGIKGNFGLATSKVTLKDYAANAQDIDNPIGKTLSYGVGYQTKGIVRTQADLDKLPGNYLIFGAKPELGMMDFQDLSGANGKPDGKIDSYDRVKIGDYMGSNSAPISFGLMFNFEYKGFTLDAMFAGLAGFNVTYNDAWSRNFGGGGKIPAYHADSWSTNNPNGSTPKLYPWGDSRAEGYVRPSDFNTYDGDFIRLKNLNLGYNIPSKILKVTGLNSVQVFVSGTNLFCWSKFKFYDPEISGFMSYPIMKTYSLGLNVQF